MVVERVFGAHLPDGLAGLLLPCIARGGGGRGDHLNGAGGFFRGLLQSRKAAFLLDEDVRLRQKLLGGGEGLLAIAAVPADGGDHLGRDPFAEGLGLGLVRAQDDIVKTGFVDSRHHLGPAGGVHFDRLPFVCVKPFGNIAVFADAEDVTHVLEDEPRLAVALDGADRVLLIGEDL